MRTTVTIDIDMTSVIDQVNIKAYYTGKGKTAEEDATAVISDIVDEDNAYVAVGSLAVALGNLKSVIGEYAPNSLSVTGEETAPKISGTITMPGNYDISANAVVMQSIRQYCEAKVLYDWLAVTSPADAEHYTVQMAQAASDLRSSLRRRVRPARKSTQV
jgi:hypothetical protein